MSKSRRPPRRGRNTRGARSLSRSRRGNHSGDADERRGIAPCSKSSLFEGPSVPKSEGKLRETDEASGRTITVFVDARETTIASVKVHEIAVPWIKAR